MNLSLHTSNQPIQPLTKADVHWICIARIWAERKSEQVRRVICMHLDAIAGLPV